MTENTEDTMRQNGRGYTTSENRTVYDSEKAQQGVRLILEAMGEDPDAPELVETWERRVPEVFETFSRGNRIDTKPEMRTFDVESTELVIKTSIPLYSFCKHHLLPYYGTVHMAYRPNGKVAGLSKLARYVRWRARRITIQEELTRDLADGFANELEAEAVLIEVTATHMCEAMRGVEAKTETTTRATAGNPTEAERRRFSDTVRRTEGTI